MTVTDPIVKPMGKLKAKAKQLAKQQDQGRSNSDFKE